MRICVLASGSKGNCTYIEGDNTRILIDAGLNKTEIERRLKLIGVQPASIDSILITHEHSDHIKGVGTFSRYYNTKVYAHPDTWNVMDSKLRTLPINQKIGIYGNDFCINELNISAINLSHDSSHCFGFSVCCGSKKFSSATDLGYIDDTIIKQLADSSLIMLEANHDINQLKINPKYPLWLKNRILSKKGHLNNQDCADAIVKMLGYGVRGIIAGHLSEENNSPDIVLQTFTKTVAKNGGDLAKEIYVDIAHQNKVGNIYRLKS